MRLATHSIFMLTATLLVSAMGCAAFHPVPGVPVRYLPDDLRVTSVASQRTINLSLLRQSPIPEHLVDSGDVLAVFVDNILGRRSDPPPQLQQSSPGNDVLPALGYQIPVRDDGMISLPLVGHLFVRGMTIAQVEDRVRQAYVEDRQYLNADGNRVLVSLQKARTHRVLVIRQEQTGENSQESNGINRGFSKRGSGKVVTLPVYRNDVLNALAETGGLPGLDAENAIYVIRGQNRRRLPGPTGPVGLEMHSTPNRTAPTHAIPQQPSRQQLPIIRGQSPDSGYEQWAAKRQAAPVWGASHDSTPVANTPDRNQFVPAKYTRGDKQNTSNTQVIQTSGEMPTPGVPQLPPGVTVEMFEQYMSQQQAAVVQPANLQVPTTVDPATSFAGWSGSPAPRGATQGQPVEFNHPQFAGMGQGAAVERGATPPQSQNVDPALNWNARRGGPWPAAMSNNMRQPLAPQNGSVAKSDWPGSAPSMATTREQSLGPAVRDALPYGSFSPDNLAPQWQNQPVVAQPAVITETGVSQAEKANSQGSSIEVSNAKAGMVFSQNTNENFWPAPHEQQNLVPIAPQQPVMQHAQPVPQGAPQAQHTPIPLAPTSSNVPTVDLSQVPPVFNTACQALGDLTIDNPNVVRIPVRIEPGQPLDISEQDIILEDGDIVFIEHRDTEVYYTGGLLGGGQFTLPRDYPLDVLEAISISQSSGRNGGGGGGNSQRSSGGISALNADVTPSGSDVVILRKLGNGEQINIKMSMYQLLRDPSQRILVQPGDFIMLQYTPAEATIAFIERHLLEGALFGVAAAQLNSSR